MTCMVIESLNFISFRIEKYGKNAHRDVDCKSICMDEAMKTGPVKCHA